MSDARNAQSGSSASVMLTLAADARIAPTDYRDDQVWELSLGDTQSGSGESALALSTRYGGRVTGASLVPMWVLDGRAIYARTAYAEQPHVLSFAPGHVRVAARITPTLQLEANYFAFDSHTVGGQFTLINTGKAPLTLRCDLVGFVAVRGREAKSAVIGLSPNGHGLRPCLLPGLEPIVMMRGEAGNADMVEGSASKIGLPVAIAAGGKSSIRWVHTATPRTDQSIAHAHDILHREWKTQYQQMAAAARALPQITTGDTAHDRAIAAGVRDLMSAYLRATNHLPHPSVVAVRRPDTGFSARGDGMDHTSGGWGGQTLPLTYLTALGTASAAPELAQGLIRNFLAVQTEDGWIDAGPGLAGQRSGQMCPPILARLAWGIFHYTEDDAFLREVYPPLLRFFRRWFAPDLDRDGDGIPEWASPAHMLYPFFPTFSMALNDAAADPQYVESPDLTAYLLSEAISLHEIGYYLREPADPWLKETIAALETALASFWDPAERRYRRRDRDAHVTPSAGVSVITDAPGSEPQFVSLALPVPNRLTVIVKGGWTHTPAFTLTITGIDADGQPVADAVPSSAFRWMTGRGQYVTERVYRQIDVIDSQGLTPVYKLSATTIDLGRADLSELMPLYAVRLPADHVAATADRAVSPAYLRIGGLSMIAADDPAWGVSTAWVSGFWNTLIAEGLIEAGRIKDATMIAARVLDDAARALKRDHVVYEYYHADSDGHSGERGHIGGAAPIHLLLRVFGVRIIDSRRVWAGGEFTWPRPVMVRQHGVTVERSPDGSRITFPSGRVITLDADAPLQELIDRKPTAGKGEPPPNVPPTSTNG